MSNPLRGADGPAPAQGACHGLQILLAGTVDHPVVLAAGVPGGAGSRRAVRSITTGSAPESAPAQSAVASGGSDSRKRRRCSCRPFEALLREQTREKAQEELSRFVELQMQLENTMQVGQWGHGRAWTRAKSLATRGDEQFVAEAFEASLASYQAAGGCAGRPHHRWARSILAEALASGAKALDARDQTAGAGISFEQRADHRSPTAPRPRQRALPGLTCCQQIIDPASGKPRITSWRGDFRAALKTYEKVQTLDAQTPTASTAAMAQLPEPVWQDMRVP